MKTFFIKEAIYKTTTFFILGKKHSEMLKIMKNKFGIDKHKIIDDDCDGTVMTFKRRKNWPTKLRVVWVDKMPRKELMEVLVHELFHLVVRICEDKGIPIVANIESGECGDEAAAYLLDYYYRQCCNKLSTK